MKTETDEYTKSGTDDEVAEQNASYDPSKVDPEKETESAGSEAKARDCGNPLEISPANKEVSKQVKEECEPEKSENESHKSRHVSPKKNMLVR